MPYIITFLEGIISFISPCLLPLLPVYVSYFAGGDRRKAGFRRVAVNAFGFVLGFSLIFTILGAFAGVFGGLFIKYRVAVNLVTGAIVAIFGINYIGIIKIPFLNTSRQGRHVKITGFFSATLFGIVFSVGWTPCVGAFLGSALMLASSRASAIQGIVLLLCYSLGLGLPFLLSALLVDTLKTAFDAVKKRYKTVNMIAGIFLIAVGALMMTGLMGRILGLFTFL